MVEMLISKETETKLLQMAGKKVVVTRRQHFHVNKAPRKTLILHTWNVSSRGSKHCSEGKSPQQLETTLRRTMPEDPSVTQARGAHINSGNKGQTRQNTGEI